MAFVMKIYLVNILWWTLVRQSFGQTCPDVCNCTDRTVVCNSCPINFVNKSVQNVSHTECRDPHIENQDGGNSSKGCTNISQLNQVTIINCTNSIQALSQFGNFSTKFLTIKNGSIALDYFQLKNANMSDTQYLDISFNRYKFLKNKTFERFKNLAHMDLSFNLICNISNESFVGLSKLTYLDLSSNKLTILNNVFSPLVNLQHLNLSWNNIETLSKGCFNSLWLLQHLDISYNCLIKVEPGALQFLPNLARLLMADNPKLGTVQMDGQLLVGTGRRLQQVDASRTGLMQIPEALTHSVRFLTLAGNKIANIQRGDLDSYPLLQSLDFTSNVINDIEDDALGRLELLLELYLNKNQLSNIPKMLPDELQYLSIKNNLITNLSIADFVNLPNLRVLLLVSNQIRYIQENVFVQLISLEILDISKNPIKTLTPNTFNGPLSLRDLRLSYLNVTQPAKDVSFPVPSPEGIKMLHLRSSPGLARQLLADTAVLAALSRLQYLDLRFNNITEVRTDLLFYLSQLRVLRLHGNAINCSKMDWLREWMTSNTTSYENESCYFSILDSTSEDRYNNTLLEIVTPKINVEYSIYTQNKKMYLNKTIATDNKKSLIKTFSKSLKTEREKIYSSNQSLYDFKPNNNSNKVNKNIKYQYVNKFNNENAFERRQINMAASKVPPKLAALFDILNENETSLRDRYLYINPIQIQQANYFSPAERKSNSTEYSQKFNFSSDNNIEMSKVVVGETVFKELDSNCKNATTDGNNTKRICFNKLNEKITPGSSPESFADLTHLEGNNATIRRDMNKKQNDVQNKKQASNNKARRYPYSAPIKATEREIEIRDEQNKAVTTNESDVLKFEKADRRNKTRKTVNKPNIHIKDKVLPKESHNDKEDTFKRIIGLDKMSKNNTEKLHDNKGRMNEQFVDSKNDTNHAQLHDQGEWSPYSAESNKYGNYLGILAVITLMTTCIILWATVRLRYRRSRNQSLTQAPEDHIEVSSISGGGLW